MNKFVKNIGFYLLLIAVSILIAQFFMNSSPSTMELPYSELVKKINNGEINQVTIIGSEKVKGNYNNRSFSVDVPSEEMPNLMQELKAADAVINTKPEPTAPWWLNILGYMLPIVIFIGAWFFIMQRMQGGGSKMMSFGKSKAKLNENKENKTFDDVANYEEVKEELEEVVQYLKNPQKFSRLGAEVPKGLLLVGPPGTGKTLMAKAIAGEAGVPFFFISGSDFVEMFVGVGASRVRDLFEKGKENAPCIIFVDELDAVGRQRGAGLGGGHDEREQTLNQLLVEMDGFEPNEGIILMAATNRPDILDPALLRPGRFDRRVVVDKPHRLGRQKILEIHTQEKPLADNVNLEILAKRTPGFTGADMENLANEAAILAARRQKDKITMNDFDDAIDRVIAGPEKKSRVISEEEKNLVAYHETGHALLGELLEHADRTHKVSIIPRGSAGGFTVPLPEEEKNFKTKNELFDQITALLGGRVSESIFLHDISTGAQNDLERATQIARAMVTEYGMSEEIGPLTLGRKHDEQVFLGRDLSRDQNYSEEVAAKIDEEVSSIVEECYNKADKLLRENKDVVEEVVKELKERETLNSEQIKKLLKGEPLPEDTSEEESAEGQKEEGEKETAASEANEEVMEDESTAEEKTEVATASEPMQAEETSEEKQQTASEKRAEGEMNFEEKVEKKQKNQERSEENMADDVKDSGN